MSPLVALSGRADRRQPWQLSAVKQPRLWLGRAGANDLGCVKTQKIEKRRECFFLRSIEIGHA